MTNPTSTLPSAADPFRDSQGKPRLVRGVTVYSGSARLAELAAQIGFEAVWIELEHSPSSWNQAEAMCTAIKAGGSVPAIRIPNWERPNVLMAVEVGSRIIVVPMVNTPEQAREVVRHAKFPPVGERGYNSRTRGVRFGIAGMSEPLLAEINNSIHLFVQIETPDAVRNLAEICDVPGLSGIFVGPGDLSMNYGWVGQLNHPDLIKIVKDIIRTARQAGKVVGIMVAPGALLTAAIEEGAQFVIVGGDIADVSVAWQNLLVSLTPNS
ncbi:MAG TPA: aldolase/citrate lyase family protein [Lacipirellulaceae bacterium]|nr:aldolase/citrate lyase family protein [Lacipirellulaceae bacterium]